MLNEPLELNHDRGFEQQILGIGQAEVGKDIAASDFNFGPGLLHGF
jgi:hypothetical protein